MTNIRLGKSYIERYGDEDFVPSDEYDSDDSEEALQFAEAIVGWVEAGLREVEPR